MERKRFEIILEAREPIAHHSETLGNSQVLMRKKIRQPDGTFAHVPTITGDTMRHGLREAGSYCLLECAGMLGEHLSEPALRLLFAGGVFSGSRGSISLDEYREMVTLLPHLALLGGCAQNRIIPGQLAVSDATLICAETMDAMPTWVQDWMEDRGTAGSREHVEEVQRVRMDPALDPGKRKLLRPAERDAVQKRLLASESAAEASDAVAIEHSKSTMLPRRFERIVSGALFFWSVDATIYSPLELDALAVMLAAFLQSARVGGKRATGHGLLVPVIGKDVRFAELAQRLSSLDLVGRDQETGQLFRKHIQDHAREVREFLGSVAA